MSKPIVTTPGGNTYTVEDKQLAFILANACAHADMLKKIEPTQPTDMIQEWMSSMFNAEIEQEEGTIKNEQAFADGADGDAKVMHEASVIAHQTYLGFLRQARERVLKSMQDGTEV